MSGESAQEEGTASAAEHPEERAPEGDASGQTHFLRRFVTAGEREIVRLHGERGVRLVRAHMTLAFAISAFERDLESVIQERADVGLTAYRLMFTLLASGPRQPSELAEATGVTSNSISSHLARLESRGLIERRRRDENRRAKTVRLTPAGRALVSAASAASVGRQQAWFGMFADEELDALVSLLSRFVDDPPPPLENGDAS